MLRDDRHGYGAVSVILHWLIAALIAGQVLLGVIMTRLLGNDPASQFQAFQWHKSFGLLTLAICLLRLGWWAFNKHPRMLGAPSAFHRAGARTIQACLLLLPVLAAVAGWAAVSVSPLAIPTYAFNLVVVPNLPLAASEQSELAWTAVHSRLVWILAAVAFGHAGAAFVHHFLLRDATLRRMFTLGRGRQSR